MNPASNSSVAKSVSSTEAHLMACLDQQEKHYSAATSVITELQRQGEDGLEKGLTALQKHLANIRTSGVQVQEAAAAHDASSQQKSALLLAALASQETRLKTFLERINGLQAEFETMKQRLQPKLDSEVTRRSMHQAYQRSMRAG